MHRLSGVCRPRRKFTLPTIRVGERLRHSSWRTSAAAGIAAISGGTYWSELVTPETSNTILTAAVMLTSIFAKDSSRHAEHQ